MEYFWFLTTLGGNSDALFLLFTVSVFSLTAKVREAGGLLPNHPLHGVDAEVGASVPIVTSEMVSEVSSWLATFRC
jgi:hypothetical protein